MSNRSPDRGKQGRPVTGAMPSLTNQPPRVLIPVTPSSGLDAIIAQMRGAGVQAVELLVPDGTAALQEVSGCERLRQAAEAAHIHLTIFTADEKTATAAKLAKLDLIPVGSAVAAPRAALPARALNPLRTASPSREGGAAVYTAPPAAPVPAASDSRMRQSPAAVQATPQRMPPAGSPTPPAAPPRARAGETGSAGAGRPSAPARPRTDDDFLAGLAAFDQAAAPPQEPARLMESDEGAMLFDAPGEIGVRRPASNDSDWDAAFGAMGTTMAAEPDPPTPAVARRQPSPASPSARLARFTQGLGGRREVPPDETPRVQRPDRTPEEIDQRRRQRVSLIVVPLVALIALLLLAGGFLLYRRFAPGAAGPTVTLTPPPGVAGATAFTGIVIPFSDQPLTGTNSIAIQGHLLQAPVTVAVGGTADTTASTPLGFATGTITLRNTTSQPIVVPAGKQLVVNGTTFVFNQAVTVPAATSNDNGVTFGRADASLSSTTAGAQGSLPANTIKSIPGFEGALRVEQAPFAGGSNQDARIVRVEDVNRVLPQAMSQLYATGVQALSLQTAATPGWELPAATITPTIDVLKRLEGMQYTVLPPIGSVALEGGRFTVEVRSQFQAIAANTANGRLDEQLAKAVRTQLVSTRGVDPHSVITVRRWTFRDQNLLVDAAVQPPNQVAAFPAGFLATVQGKIANQPRDVAEQYLQQLVDDHQLAALPQLPLEWQTVPANVKLIAAAR